MINILFWKLSIVWGLLPSVCFDFNFCEVLYFASNYEKFFDRLIDSLIDSLIDNSKTELLITDFSAYHLACPESLFILSLGRMSCFFFLFFCFIFLLFTF